MAQKTSVVHDEDDFQYSPRRKSFSPEQTASALARQQKIVEAAEREENIARWKAEDAQRRAAQVEVWAEESRKRAERARLRSASATKIAKQESTILGHLQGAAGLFGAQVGKQARAVQAFAGNAGERARHFFGKK